MIVDRLQYRPVSGMYDEVVLPDGHVREASAPIVEAFSSMGMPELQHRKEQAEQLLRENDVTYTIYDRGGERPWQLDLFPVVMRNDEWMKLERGLLQRAELFERIVRDLYGQRRLLKEGVIPPAAVLSAPGFLRPADGMLVPDEPALFFFASDLARNRAGDFEVLADRIQAPSGSGYALENRIVLSRVLAGLYRESNVHRVAGYFRSLKASLQNPGRRIDALDTPSVALLTPGPQNETYFEHAYLSGYLNFPLVQGEDLIVRDQRLYMRTVNGLEQVDVLFRRVEDQYLDATELRGDSLLGVPGLLEAIRAGNVRCANPVGSAVLEDRFIFPYLDRMCRFFFKEDLILPNAETLWLGDAAHRSRFFENPGDYVVKSSDRTIPPVFPEDMEFSLQEIRTCPQRYVAQRILPGSTSPVFHDSRIMPARSLFRLFTTAGESGFRVMPGGLVRVSSDLSSRAVTNQSGAASKDLWILSDEPVRAITLLGESVPEARIRRENRIPNRIADDFFWMGRYAERSENASRLFREVGRTVLKYENGDLGSDEAVSVFALLLRYTEAPAHPPSSEYLQRIYTGDGQWKQGPAWIHRAFLNTCRSLRSYLSDDARTVIARLRVNPEQRGSEALFSLVQDRIILLGSLSGLLREGMTREDGWTFIDVGSRIERALHILSMCGQLLSYEKEEALPSVVLNAGDLRITYRRRFGNAIDLDSVLRLLLFEERSPRSLIWQLQRIHECVLRLPAAGLSRSALDQMAERLSLPMTSTEDRATMLAALQTLQLQIEQLADRIATIYFPAGERPMSVEFRDG